MNSRGFTLLEVVVAIFILTVGAGAAFTLIQQSLVTVSLAEDRLIASFLVQEGIELVKNMRDTNWLESVPWDDGISAGDWEADYLAQGLTDNYDGDYLNIDGNGFYSYSAGAPTKFKRKINIVKESSAKIKIAVAVEWQERGRTHFSRVLGYINNWYE